MEALEQYREMVQELDAIVVGARPRDVPGHVREPPRRGTARRIRSITGWTTPDSGPRAIHPEDRVRIVALWRDARRRRRRPGARISHDRRPTERVGVDARRDARACGTRAGGGECAGVRHGHHRAQARRGGAAAERGAQGRDPRVRAGRHHRHRSSGPDHRVQPGRRADVRLPARRGAGTRDGGRSSFRPGCATRIATASPTISRPARAGSWDAASSSAPCARTAASSRSSSR